VVASELRSQRGIKLVFSPASSVIKTPAEEAVELVSRFESRTKQSTLAGGDSALGQG